MKVDIKGVIVPNDQRGIYDMFGMESTSPNIVTDAINNADGGDLELIVNSGGGDLFSGSEIFSTLKDYPGKVVVKVYGVAASAASIICMGADEIKMSPTASLMVHNPAVMNYGDHNDMEHASDMLKTLNKTVAGAYQKKTGLSQEELLNLMETETWMDAGTAHKKGFVDEILFQDETTKAVANAGNMIPQQVINSIRNKKINQVNNELSDDDKKEVRQIVREEIKKQSQKDNSNQIKPVNSWLF